MMKRTGEGSVSSSPLRKPSGCSRRESGQGQSGSGNKGGGGGVGSGPVRKITTEVAVSFVLKVKQTFEQERDKYQEFLEVLKDFKYNRIEIGCVVGRMKEILRGHDDLIAGFWIFLPDEYQV